MRYLLLLLLVGCGGGQNSTAPVPIELPVIKSKFEQIYPEFRDRTDGFGITTKLNENSWNYQSHLIDYPACERAKKHYCRKTDSHYKDIAHQPGRETKYTWDLTITKWNFTDSIEWIILWQDWVKVDPLEPTGNHPITTIKLRNWRGLSISHFENSWQWDYRISTPYDMEDPFDSRHRHPGDQWHGQKQLQLGQKYAIELIIKDGLTIEDGEIIFKVDGQLISHQYYQTKSSISKSTIQWGMYWDNKYNARENDCVEETGLLELECKSNQVLFENFEVWERF